MHHYSLPTTHYPLLTTHMPNGPAPPCSLPTSPPRRCPMPPQPCPSMPAPTLQCHSLSVVSALRTQRLCHSFSVARALLARTHHPKPHTTALNAGSVSTPRIPAADRKGPNMIAAERPVCPFCHSSFLNKQSLQAHLDTARRGKTKRCDGKTVHSKPA